MRQLAGLLFLSILMAGCAAYKELEPDPEILPNENGYIELKNGKDNFELEKDKKYFMKLPRPVENNFYLVFVTASKPALSSFLTNTFDGEGPFTPIPDEAKSSDSISVYAIDARSPAFYWVIDTVKQDVVLWMKYRYVPQWRYTIENKYAEFQQTLAENTADRSTYQSIDINFSFEDFDFSREIPPLEEKTGHLKTMQEELLRVEKVFPANIASSKDTAYEKYVALKSKLDDELTFQQNYATILKLFKKEKETRGNVPAFLEAVPYFTSVMTQQKRFPQNAHVKASHVLLDRLGEVSPYFETMLKGKVDLQRISPQPSLSALSGLYQACGPKIPRDVENLVRFVSRFNTEADSLRACQGKFEALKGSFDARLASATGETFAGLVSRVGEIKASIPEAQTNKFERYNTYDCTVLLGNEIRKAGVRANDLETLYKSSEEVSGNIAARVWASAEMRLRELHEMQPASEYPEVPTQRSALVKRFEQEIFSGVKSASQQRIDAFIKDHEMAIDNVPALYTDSAFLPVYTLTFSSLGPNDLLRKRKEIDSYLEHIKYNQFPESSIKSIYADFNRNSRDRGVEKARAIVEHGKFYRGDDKQVKGLIVECDVEAAKWIIRPKEYRKLFALPVTSNKQGTNDYMFRVRLNIPSEAQFPVFDVNLKLPQEVAEKSKQEQWFQSITIDKKPIKNEGRFRVTSPTAENNYEVLITPVQMDKEGKNILEVRFKYPGFRVFEVSTMAQVPIIRKN